MMMMLSKAASCFWHLCLQCLSGSNFSMLPSLLACYAAFGIEHCTHCKLYNLYFIYKLEASGRIQMRCTEVSDIITSLLNLNRAAALPPWTEKLEAAASQHGKRHHVIEQHSIATPSSVSCYHHTTKSKPRHECLLHHTPADATAASHARGLCWTRRLNTVSIDMAERICADTATTTFQQICNRTAGTV
jgi:hypothetical protein